MTVGDRMAGPDPAEANPGPLGATRAHYGTCAHYGTYTCVHASGLDTVFRGGNGPR